MSITTNINYPAGLPLALRQGRSTQHGTPFIRTQLDSGRARQRRRFTSVPSVQTFVWFFTDLECRVFEAWFRDAVQDGAAWFSMPVRTPLPEDLRTPLVCRFVQMYTGPDIIGRDRWKISATLEVWERPLFPPGWGLLPDYMMGSDIFDMAMNREWPRL